MIKRNKRNIGKIVKVNSPSSISGFHGRTGKVVGFRGDLQKGDPYVEVFIYNLHDKNGAVYPFAGHLLTEAKEV